jgi:hypothetical protein
MPNVKKEGSVIEFAYEIKSNFGKSKRLDLQTSIPVNYSEYVMSVPEYFTSVLI